jgi:hypothetical protein
MHFSTENFLGKDTSAPFGIENIARNYGFAKNDKCRDNEADYF